MSSTLETFPRERAMSYPAYTVYPIRFYVLFLFCFLAFNQCLIWSTFAPIYDGTESYYNVTDATVDLFLAWGPICFIPFLPLTYLLLNRENGLRYCVIVLSIVELLATIIRIIPSIFISSKNVNFSSISLPFLHVGQILNAACGPLAMAPVSQLSSLWFGTNERTRATTVAIMAYNLGSTLSFPLGPAIVSSPDDIPHLLYIHTGLAFIGCVLTLIYFPSQPPTPPSPAAELLIKRSNNEQSTKLSQSYIKNIKDCFTTPSFVLLVIASGLISGTFGVWTSIFDTILQPLDYSDKLIGWIGLTSSLSEITGGFILAPIADMPRFHHSYKILMVISFICYFISVLWFNLSVHNLFMDQPIIPSHPITIAISAGLSGLFQGAASPLTYESLAEIMYPLPESLSASILVQFVNLTALVLFFIAPDSYKLLNLIILIIIFICTILTLLTKFHYKRRDADRIIRRTLVAYDTDTINNTSRNNSITNVSNGDIEIDTIPMDSMNDTNPILQLSDL